MRKDRFIEFQFDLEIERTVRRLGREQRNSKIAQKWITCKIWETWILTGHYNLSMFKKDKMGTLIRDNQQQQYHLQGR